MLRIKNGESQTKIRRAPPEADRHVADSRPCAKLALERADLLELLANPSLSAYLPNVREGNSRQTLPQKKHFPPPEVRKEMIRRGFKYPQHAKRIAFLMCKGGVGKTTLSYFLGMRLASFGARVLFIDSDPQGNLTSALGLLDDGKRAFQRIPVLVDVLAHRISLKNAILNVHSSLDLLPSTAVNSLLERDLLNLRMDPIQRLHQVLKSVEKDYDYILIDCAPTLNIFNASVAYAADMLILPFLLNEFSKIGLSQTVSEIQDLEKQFMFRTEVKAILNFYSASDPIGRDYLHSLSTSYKSIFMQSVIRHSIEIQRSLAYGEDFFKMRPSAPREDFDRLAIEVLGTSFASRELNARHE